MVGHTYIYSPVVRRIKKIIDHGDIGEVLYISSRRLNLGLFQNEINVAWDLAPHDLSIILYLVGGSPRTVSCHGRCHHSRCVEDITSIVLEFPRGGFAMIHSSWLDPNKVRDMTIVGSRRMILYNDLEPLEKIKIYDKRVDTPPHYDSFAEFHYSYHYGDTYSPYVKQEEPLKLEAAHFLHCIRTGAVPDTDGYNGFEVVRILEAASRSLKNGGSRMDLEPVTRKSLKVAVGATPLQQGTGSRKK
jgi:predicted dehydrogenase